VRYTCGTHIEEFSVRKRIWSSSCQILGIAIGGIRVGVCPMSEMLGNQYFLNGQYEKALAQYSDVLAQNPHNKAVLIHTILAEVRLGKLQEALEHVDRLLSLGAPKIIPENAYLDPVCRAFHGEDGMQSEDIENALARGVLNLLCGKQADARRLFQQYQAEPQWRERIESILTKLENLTQNAKI